LLEDQRGAIDQIKNDVNALRCSYPRKDVPDSILGHRRNAGSIFADTASVIGDAEFSFDDIIVNSKAHRRVMAAAVSQSKAQTEDSTLVPEGDLIDLSTDERKTMSPQYQIPADLQSLTFPESVKEQEDQIPPDMGSKFSFLELSQPSESKYSPTLVPSIMAPSQNSGGEVINLGQPSISTAPQPESSRLSQPSSASTSKSSQRMSVSDPSNTLPVSSTTLSPPGRPAPRTAVTLAHSPGPALLSHVATM
jgi:hypothetical protein